MSRSESTAGSQSGVNPMSGAESYVDRSQPDIGIRWISIKFRILGNPARHHKIPHETRCPGSITEIRMISGIRPAVLQILKTENDRSRVIQSFAGTDRLRSAQNFAGIDHLRAAQDLAGIHPLRVLHRFSEHQSGKQCPEHE